MTDEITIEVLQEKVKALIGENKWAEAKPFLNELSKREKAEADAKKAELQKKLAETGSIVKGILDQVVRFLTGGQAPDKQATGDFAAALRKLTGKELDGADGIWYAYDFGETGSGIKLMKSKGITSSGGTSSGKSSYVADNRKSEDMLKDIGSRVMFAEATEVTIDKQKHTMEAGTTYEAAYKFSTNGGWRNRVRMAILKEHDKFLAENKPA